MPVKYIMEYFIFAVEYIMYCIDCKTGVNICQKCDIFAPPPFKKKKDFAPKYSENFPFFPILPPLNPLWFLVNHSNVFPSQAIIHIFIHK